MQFNFDASQVDPGTPGGGVDIPTGWYPVVITSDQQVQTKNNAQNYFLELDLSIIEGAHAGTTGLKKRLNLWHDNQQAVEIAYKDLSAICRAVGVVPMTSTEQLWNKPFLVRVVNDGQGGDCKGCKPYEGASGTGTSPGPGPSGAMGAQPQQYGQQPTQPPAQQFTANYGQQPPPQYAQTQPTQQQHEPVQQYGQQPAPAHQSGPQPGAVPEWAKQGQAAQVPAQNTNVPAQNTQAPAQGNASGVPWRNQG